MANTEILNKAKGSLVGLAIGDALGTTLEFSHRKRTKKTQIEMVGNGPFSLPAGYWTDDTSMALCLADSLIEKGFDPNDQMKRYLDWYENGYRSSTGKCFDIGRTTLRSLALYKKFSDPAGGIDGDLDAGNGSIMRLAPVIIWALNYGLDSTVEYAMASSKTTHGNIECLSACAYLAEIIFNLISGKTKEESLLASSLYSKNAAGSILNFRLLNPDTAPNSGYVIDTLKSALWAFYTTTTFENGIIKSIQLGGDADTIGAVYGQIAGAYYGLNNIPIKWRQNLYLYDEITEIGKKLLNKKISEELCI